MQVTLLLSSVPEGPIQIQNITKETHIHYKRDQYIPKKRPIKHKEETYTYKQNERYQRQLCKKHLYFLAYLKRQPRFKTRLNRPIYIQKET